SSARWCNFRARLLILALILTATSLMATTASAHRFAPSLLELEQLPDAIVSVQWRRPLQADPSVSPVLPDACSVMDQPQSRIDSGAIVMRWHLRCPEDQARVVSVQGLDQSRTAAL